MIRIFPESDTEENVLRESFTEHFFAGISKFGRCGLQ